MKSGDLLNDPVVDQAKYVWITDETDFDDSTDFLKMITDETDPLISRIFSK